MPNAYRTLGQRCKPRYLFQAICDVKRAGGVRWDRRTHDAIPNRLRRQADRRSSARIVTIQKRENPIFLARPRGSILCPHFIPACFKRFSTFLRNTLPSRLDGTFETRVARFRRAPRNARCTPRRPPALHGRMPGAPRLPSAPWRTSALPEWMDVRVRDECLRPAR